MGRPLTEPGGLAAVFGGPSSDSDTRAARNLASAFTRDVTPDESPTAEGDLSLDHLFRDATPPDAGPVSLDEFYAPPSAAPAAASNASAEPDPDRTADIRQFNSWLEGLRKK
jgi:hypothetical protein